MKKIKEKIKTTKKQAFELTEFLYFWMKIGFLSFAGFLFLHNYLTGITL